MRRSTAAGRACAALLGLTLAADVFGYEPLTDEQLDAVTAGADGAQLEEIVVHAARMTASGKQVTADGTVAVQRAAGPIDPVELLLRDSAQSNLQALVNLNAVHSAVNVLVNLNINIDSQVGELHQINLASPSGR